MRVETLPSPGTLAQGFLLRRTAAQAISACEITARATPGGKIRTAATLSAFFTACAAALADITDATAPLISATTTTRTSATTYTMVFTENMDTSVLPATSTITIPSRTVTALAWTNATTLTITVASGAVAGDVVTYTAPATNGLRDVPGNLVATGSKTSV